MGNRVTAFIGDTLGHCFTFSGECVTTDLADKMVSIPLDLHWNVPERIAVARGLKKALVIRALAPSVMISTLVTDEKTAS
jgi:DNA-binding transcriptional regulator LsrR (DeoR family)